ERLQMLALEACSLRDRPRPFELFERHPPPERERAIKMPELLACVRCGVRQLQSLLERNRVESVARDVEHVPARVSYQRRRRIFGEELAQLGDVRLHGCDTGFRVLRPEL